MLELNPEHAAVKALGECIGRGDTERAEKYARILYDQAVIAADLPLDDPAAYMERVCSLME